VGPDCPRNMRLNSRVQIFHWGDVKISDGSTSLADEMIMLFDRCVVSAKSLTKIQLTDLSLTLENVKISIHCSEGYTRNLLPHSFVHPFSGGMRSGSRQNLEYLLSLPAALCAERLHCDRGTSMRPTKIYQTHAVMSRKLTRMGIRLLYKRASPETRRFTSKRLTLPGITSTMV